MRAWLLFLTKRKRGLRSRLGLLERSVRETLKVLRETDERLYECAVRGTREVEKRFPLVMRIPTDTLPTKGWNYRWSPLNIKGHGGVSQPG
jgi:large subunit ribosomal protein L40